MNVKFSYELKDFSKYKIGDPCGYQNFDMFKSSYNKYGLLYNLLFLAALSRGQSFFKNYSNLDFIFDIDLFELKSFVDGIDFDDYPKDKDFFVLIEMWGKHTIHKVTVL